MCMISGGDWTSTSYAGPWPVSLHDTRTHSYVYVGVRCADYEAESSRSKTKWTQWSHRDVLSCLLKIFFKFGEICNRIFFLVMPYENQEILFSK